MSSNFEGYEKKIRDIEEQKKKLNPFKKFKFLDSDYIKLQKRRFENLLSRNYETKREIKLWQTFLRIVQESFKTDNKKQKFSLNHVLKLGIEWDILFLYSKKDVGKTWAVAKYVEELLIKDPNAQIMFIRNSKEEAKGFVEMMNNNSNWITWTNGELVFKKEDIRKNKGRTTGLDPCGFFAYASGAGFTRWQGGDWERLRFWNWDECNSVQGGLTEEVFKALNVLLSSLVRDKNNVRGIMSGNLLEKSNIFLERLGVGSKTRLKIFDIHLDNNPKKELLSRLLYLNTGELFKGIEEQKGLATQFLTEEEQESLLNNRPGLNTSKAFYEELDLKNFYPKTAFVFTEKVENVMTGKNTYKDYILYSYAIPGSQRTVIWIDRFSTTRIKPGFSYIYCQDSILANKYSMLVPIEEKEDFGESFIEPIEETLYKGEIWFGWNGTQEIFEDVWDGLRSRYIKEDENSI